MEKIKPNYKNFTMAALVMQVNGFQFQGKVLRQFCAIFRAK